MDADTGVFIGRGAALGMAICSENRRVGRVANPSYILIRRGVARVMSIWSEDYRGDTEVSESSVPPWYDLHPQRPWEKV